MDPNQVELPATITDVMNEKTKAHNVIVGNLLFLDDYNSNNGEYNEMPRTLISKNDNSDQVSTPVIKTYHNTMILPLSMEALIADHPKQLMNIIYFCFMSSCCFRFA